MGLDRDELAARFAVAQYGPPDEAGLPKDVARRAVEMADALLAALAPVDAAPGKYVPKVGDVVSVGGEMYGEVVLTKIGVEGGLSFDGWILRETVSPRESPRAGSWSYMRHDSLCYLRPATAAERAAAGLPVEAVAPVASHSSPGGGTSQVGGAAERDAGIVTPASSTLDAPTESKGKVAREWTNADPSRSPVVTPTTKSPEDGENQRGEENSDPPPLDPDTHPLREEALAAWEKKYVRQAILSNTHPSHFKKFLQGYIAGHADARASGRLATTPAPAASHSSPGGGTSQVGGAAERDAGIVTPASPTPAPEAKRPTHVRVTKIGDVGFDVAEGSVYEVVRWYDDGGGAVSPQVMADNGELVELAYVDHSDADYCPSWEPAPCPPPVAGSAEKDEAFKALLAYAECEEAAWGCGELEPTLVLHGKKRNEHAHEFLKRLRTKALALSRPVRP